MATLPSVTTTVSEDAGVPGSGSDLVCIWSPVLNSADALPRFFGSAKAVYDLHGYCEGVEYAALHASQTGKGFLFCGLPIATAGAITISATGGTGTAVASVAAASGGVLAEHDGVLKAVNSGIVGTDQIRLEYSLDDGFTFQPLRLGTATAASIPYFNVNLAFATGTVVAGDTILTWHGSAPKSNATGWGDARDALAAQAKLFRSVLLCGDLASHTEAASLLTEINGYATANERFIFARASVRDMGTGDATKAAWMASLETEYATIDGQPRIDLGAGRGRINSPFSSWYMRRNAAWFASLREYQHDLHIPVWRKKDGPCGADLLDLDGNLAEWDDRVDGGAGSAARFTTLRTWGNGPGGGFITLSLTRATDGSVLGYTHNEAVTNLACSTVQAAAEDAAIGESLLLNPDGTATKDSLATIEARINAALKLALLTNRGEGPRASKAVATVDPTTDFSVAEPTAVITTELDLRGTIHSVTNIVRLNSGS